MNWYIPTAQRICVDTSQREYTDPMGLRLACSPIYFRRPAETLPAQSLLASDGTNQVNPSHAPSHSLCENNGLDALGSWKAAEGYG